MKSLLSLFFVAAFIGCERSSNHGLTPDVQARVVLKEALVEAQLALVDKTNAVFSVAELVAALEKQGHMARLFSYGSTNLFFNPTLTLWSDAAFGKQTNGPTQAIVIRRSKSDYVGITFDGRFFKEQRCPAKWCE